MEPVVNGLEQDFGSQVEFQRINASDSDGREIFQSYNLRGHPAYVILNSKADVLWFGFGEQARDILAQQIHLALDI
jgi:hypothetical protein